jgi:hypothetical protein
VLDARQLPEVLGSNLGVVGNECAEVQLREGGDAHRKFSFQRGDVGSDQHAGIEESAGLPQPRSWASASRRSRSATQRASARPTKTEAMSA